MLRSLVLCLAAALAVSAPATAGRPMTVADLFTFQRVADPQVSPDGKRVVYQVGTVDLAANKTITNLWIADTDGKSPPRRLTTSSKSDRHPRWSPDGTRILFESNRSGETQLWVIDMAGGEARQLTHLSTGASNGIWSPDGKTIAFVSAVYPEFSELPSAESDKKNKEKAGAIEKSPVKAKVFSRLFYRHWVEYVEDKRQHLFVVEAAGGEPRDVTPGDRDAYPTSTTFSSAEDFTFSPEGMHLVFTAVPEKNEAWSTNYELCRVGVKNTSPRWETLTRDNTAADTGPQFRLGHLYWRAQKKAGYEADKWDLVRARVETDGRLGPVENLTAAFDLSVNEFAFVGRDIVFTADKDGRTPLLHLERKGDASGAVRLRTVTTDGVVSGLSVGTRPGRTGENVLSYSLAMLNQPPEVITRVGAGESLLLGAAGDNGTGNRTGGNVSRANADLLGQLDLPRPESVSVPVDGAKMQMWVLKPPGFDPKKKWPVVYLVHGGPQGAWEDGWSYRWNPELWAAQGYVVVLPNPRGSTGFGQKFVDEISGDWGGKCYRDLVAGLDYTEKLPYVDKDRMAAAGASFGGYMMDWFAVNEISKRFKCLISHCSVWNFESMWGTTDELWFDEYEHGGLPWEKPGAYAEFSPHKKAANLGKYKTPMLLVQNDLDFRCPVGQGLELFTALQRQHVPSKLISFPDEGHWVLKPRNSEYWHKEVFGWLTKYCPPGGK